MDPLKVSAMFAAYVWFTSHNDGVPTAEKEAVSFVRDNWQTFLPSAREGLGRLLLRIAEGRNRGKGKSKAARSRGRTMAGAGAG